MRTAAAIAPALAEGEGVSEMFPGVSEFNSVTALEIVAEYVIASEDCGFAVLFYACDAGT
jgi:hypothetical protein